MTYADSSSARPYWQYHPYGEPLYYPYGDSPYNFGLTYPPPTPPKHSCTLCYDDNEVREFGTKYICQKCTNRLIDEALRADELKRSSEE